MNDSDIIWNKDLHNNKIWISTDGAYCTYVMTKDGRKLKKRKTKEELFKALEKFYADVPDNKKTTTQKYLEEFKKDFSRYKEINIWGIKSGMYLISPVGDIYSTHKKDWLNGEITGATGNYRGVKTVWLRMEDPSIGAKRFYVARLTMAMFNGLPPSDMKDPTVDHIDCDPLNNYYKNLRWVERDVNTSLRFSRGIGEENGRSKLTQDNVIQICNDLIKKKATIPQLAEKYNVAEFTINNIVNHKTWKYISCLFQFEGVC